MKKIPVIVWLPLVFIAGGLVGYYGPAEELRSRDVREQEEKAKPKPRNAFGVIALTPGRSLEEAYLGK